MLIGQTPCFSLKDVMMKRRKRNMHVYPLNSKNYHLFFSARYAIGAGIKVLGISPKHNILIPSYNCGTEIDPILDQKVKVKYYGIKRNLAIDIEDMIKQIDAHTAAILVTHYFGFPQPIDEIREICDTRGLFLIEDCAHAFLTVYKSKNVGTFGDISIFSLRKTLPIPNGGALVINNENYKFKEKLNRPSILSDLFIAIELLQGRTRVDYLMIQKIITDMIINGLAFLNKNTKFILRIIRKMSLYDSLALVHVNYYEFRREMIKWKISILSERIMSTIDYRKIKETRRRNFKYLLTKLPEMQNIKVVFDNLPQGVCPLIFPILVKDRQYVYKRFRENSIKPHQYWKYKHEAVPWNKFPQAVFLKEHVLGLPIHQDLSLEHLDRMIKVIKKLID